VSGLTIHRTCWLASSLHCQSVHVEDSYSCIMVNKQWMFCTVRCCSKTGLKASTGMYNWTISIPLSPKKKGRWFWNGTRHFECKFTKVYWAERRLQQILFLNQRSFGQINFTILTLWTSRNQTSLDFLSRSQLVVDECGSSSFNNKTSRMLPQHHHVVPFRSWKETKNKVGSCDNLNLLIFSSKIPGALTIS